MLNQFTWILIVGFSFGNSADKFEHFLDKKFTAQNHFRQAFQEFLNKIYAEKLYETIYLQGHQQHKYCISALPLNFPCPILISQGSPPIYFKSSFNSQLLSLLCLRKLDEKQALENLALNLNHMRWSRIIVMVTTALDSENLNAVKTFFKWCEHLKFPNVIIIHKHTFETEHRYGNYYSYTQFPKFELEQHNYTFKDKSKAFFPNRLKNMHGKILLTLPDQIEPRSMLYTDKKGVEQITGYVWKFVRTFAEHYNCTIRFPYNISNDASIYIADLRTATRNETIDFATSLTITQRETRIQEFIYPIETGRWLTMLPIEPPQPIRTLMMRLTLVYLIILSIECCLLGTLVTLEKTNFVNCSSFSSRNFLLNSFLSPTVLLGLLGAPFKSRKRLNYRAKYNIFLLFIAGLFFNTSYGAYLVQFFTAPPTDAPITSFEDAIRRGLHVLVAKEELSALIFFLGNASWIRYQSVFKVVTLKEFKHKRSTMDTNYAYTTTTSTWPIYRAQQEYFEKKLFRLSSELRYAETLQFSLPIHENSIYKSAFNPFALRVNEVGLLRYWFDMSFYDMVALKRVSFKDLSHAPKLDALRLQDIYFIWIGYGVLLGVAFLIFLCEISFRMIQQ